MNKPFKTYDIPHLGKVEIYQTSGENKALGKFYFNCSEIENGFGYSTIEEVEKIMNERVKKKLSSKGKDLLNKIKDINEQITSIDELLRLKNFERYAFQSDKTDGGKK